MPDSNRRVPVALRWSKVKMVETGLPLAFRMVEVRAPSAPGALRPGHGNFTWPMLSSHAFTAGIWLIEKTTMMIA